MADIIPFPRERQQMCFAHWLSHRVGGKWYVVKQRRASRKYFPPDAVQLLGRECDAYEREYIALYGAREYPTHRCEPCARRARRGVHAAGRS